ncbi:MULTISPECIES: Rv2578c family radical SAM protein [unclassified Microbacterium]|uniref:Rv2578c family radical SAM protein n=1 Tax=unclassified Microbacterium TaxID=2609290 RepID=UPI000EA9C82D|nr:MULTISPECIES: Rv2578c family radical SAM protein [unclassified Microbacterium]MBT2484502.1 Rv2578c family radical SAM protein [Microbacterium sp. ISL-108]RKN67406.1 radical SAM protein [Microbacterium sp. CGR2]
MRWQGQKVGETDAAALPGMEDRNIIRSVTTPEFAGMTFHEVLAKSALNHVPGASRMPFAWTINPYRGCSHACVYCFARGTHEYLDLDGGADFDSQIVVKVNVVDVLEKELRRGSWQHETVALGTNTDPYQRAEGRYKLMPGIIDALAASGTPMSILTKGTLIRRDIPLLVAAGTRVPVDVQMSIAMYDDELQKAIEPGAPTTQARLDTVRALADAGFRATVFLMPIMPHMTDSVEAIDDALRRIKEAGARRVIYGALHLRPGVKPWFMKWLGEARPDLVSSYLGLYPGMSAEAPKPYRQWLAKRARPLIRMHGLDGSDEEDLTPWRGSFARTAPATRSASAPALATAPQPMLF